MSTNSTSVNLLGLSPLVDIATIAGTLILALIFLVEFQGYRREKRSLFLDELLRHFTTVYNVLGELQATRVEGGNASELSWTRRFLLSYDLSRTIDLKLHDGTLVTSPTFDEARKHIEGDLGNYLKMVEETNAAVADWNREIAEQREKLRSKVRDELSKLAEVTDNLTSPDALYLPPIMNFLEQSWLGTLVLAPFRTLEESVAQITPTANFVGVQGNIVYLGGAVIGRSSPGFEINKINEAIIALLKDMNILGSLVDRSRNRDALHLKLEQELSTHSKEVWEVRKRLVGKDTYKKRYDCCPKKPKLLL